MTKKRLFDLLLSILGLLVLSPIFIIIIIIIFIFMGRPIFFIQTRPGYLGKPFKLLKFRTMIEANKDKSSSADESYRIKPLGKFLRRTSLDELPELINVIKGDMSLVGPRPLLMDYLPYYTSEQFKRHDVLPGITGFAQIRGRNALSWEEKFDLDLWYIKNRNILLDVRILIETISVVLSGKGVSAKNHVSMPRFDEKIISESNKENSFEQ